MVYTPRHRTPHHTTPDHTTPPAPGHLSTNAAAKADVRPWRDGDGRVEGLRGRIRKHGGSSLEYVQRIKETVDAFELSSGNAHINAAIS